MFFLFYDDNDNDDDCDDDDDDDDDEQPGAARDGAAARAVKRKLRQTVTRSRVVLMESQLFVQPTRAQVTKTLLFCFRNLV